MAGALRGEKAHPSMNPKNENANRYETIVPNFKEEIVFGSWQATAWQNAFLESKKLI